MQLSKRIQLIMLIAECAVAACASGIALGQTPAVLSEKDVTPEALIDSLRPPERTRAIRVRPTGTSGPAAAPERPSASLLITFETNSTTLTPGARRTLDVVATALKSAELGESQFLIEGHADPRGNPEANLRLSEGRAAAVRQYLLESHGVPAQRVSSIGKGDRELMNRTNIAAPENRRVTIVNTSN